MSADDELACQRLVIESAAHNDARDWAALAGLYAEDAVLTRPSGEQIVGRAAIEASYAAGPPNRRTRHVVSNFRFDSAYDSSARGDASVVIYSWDATAERDPRFGYPLDSRVVVGDFEDEFVRTQQGWRIGARRASLVAHS
jgi:ketosteroid isomerase-like protein